MNTSSQADEILEFIRMKRIIRPRDLAAIGIARTVLERLVARGDVIRRSRGIYTLSDHEPTRHTDLAEVCARVPSAVVCLISALEFHGLTTQVPHAVWIMIDRAAHKPKIFHPPTRLVYASGESLSAGVGTHRIEGIQVRITNPAKTVADCFKYRHHVGQDVAIEALRDCLAQRKATPGELYQFARVDRVARTIRPYIEAMT